MHNPDELEQWDLCFAAEDGDIETAKRLLAAGLDVNGYCEDMPKAPLHFAAEACRIEMVRFLLSAGADPIRHDPEQIGDTPLGEAAAVCTLEVARCLTDAGADPTIRGWMQLNAVDRAARRSDPEGRKVIAHLLAVADGNTAP